MINVNGSLIEEIQKDENFLYVVKISYYKKYNYFLFSTMVYERPSKDSATLLNNFYSIYDITADSLLNYFQPLEAYLETAPLIQEKIHATTNTTNKTNSMKEKKLEKLRNITADKTTTNQPTISHHTIGPEPHRHYHEDLQEGNNPAMQQISMYIGIGLLLGVVAVILFAIAKKTIWKPKNNTNRRYQT